MIKLFEKPMFRIVPVLTFFTLACFHFVDKEKNAGLFTSLLILMSVFVILNIFIVKANYQKSKSTGSRRIALLVGFLIVCMVIYLIQRFI